jgi:hypothetical protein
MNESAHSVRWSQPPLAFELCSSDTALLERAALLFSPWRSDRPVTPLCRWRVEPLTGDCPGQKNLWGIWSATVPDMLLCKETPEQALMGVEFLAVQALVEHPHGPLTLHGALVAKNGKGVAILGPSEAGKSTLACARWQRGWSLLCDDVALIEREHLTARPTPRRVSLRRASRVLLGEDLWARILSSPSCDQTAEGCLFHPHEVSGQKHLDGTRLTTVIFLARRGSITAPARLRRLVPAHALFALLPYSNFAHLGDPQRGTHRLQPLAADVPAYDLGRGPLGDMVESIEQVLAGAN